MYTKLNLIFTSGEKENEMEKLNCIYGVLFL